MAGSRSPIRCVPYREVYGEGFEEPQRRVSDICRLRALGYLPAVTLRQGLEAVVAWARKCPEGPIGQAVSIVGALVIGQAAVSAGLIGSLMVIVVALTGGCHLCGARPR